MIAVSVGLADSCQQFNEELMRDAGRGKARRTATIRRELEDVESAILNREEPSLLVVKRHRKILVVHRDRLRRGLVSRRLRT